MHLVIPVKFYYFYIYIAPLDSMFEGVEAILAFKCASFKHTNLKPLIYLAMYTVTGEFFCVGLIIARLRLPPVLTKI